MQNKHLKMSRALVLSGTGNLLNFAAGCVCSLHHTHQHCWDYVYGVSGGALIAAFLCMFDLGKESEAIKQLDVLCSKITEINVAGEYLVGGWISFMTKGALYHNRHLEHIIKKFIDPEKIRISRRKLNIYAYDVVLKQNRLFTNEDSTILWEALLASCSLPFLFSPVPIIHADGTYGFYADGAMGSFIPLHDALNNASIRSIDVISTLPKEKVLKKHLHHQTHFGKHPQIGMFDVFNSFIEKNQDDSLKYAELKNALSILHRNKSTLSKVEQEWLRILEKKYNLNESDLGPFQTITWIFYPDEITRPGIDLTICNKSFQFELAMEAVKMATYSN